MEAAVIPGRLSASNGVHALSQNGSMQLGGKHVSGGPFLQLDLQQQQQHAFGESQQRHVASAVLDQQKADGQQMQNSNACSHGSNGHMLPSADFALFAQLHLHNPAPATRHLQRQQTPPHPVFESFPSFTGSENQLQLSSVQHEAVDAATIEREAATECIVSTQQPGPEPSTGDAHTAQMQQPGPEPSTGDAHTAQMQAAPVSGMQHLAAHEIAAETDESPASSSDAAVVLSGSGSQQAQGQHGTHRKVSLLSQQIACARSSAAAAAGDDHLGIQSQEVGSTHHHASKFWQYMQQAQRAQHAAEGDAALSRHSSSSQPSRQPCQQQQPQQPQQQVIIQVEEASPLSKGWTHAAKQRHQQQVQQQCRQQAQQPPRTDQRQQHTQRQYHGQQQKESENLQLQQRHQHLPPLPPRLSSVPCSKHQLQPQYALQQHLDHHQQQQACSGHSASHQSAAAAAALPGDGEADRSAPAAALATAPATTAAGVPPAAAATRCRMTDAGSACSSELLDMGADSQGGVGWSRHYISGCAAAPALPTAGDVQGIAGQDSLPSSSQQQATLQSQHSGGAQQLLLYGQSSETDLAGLLEQQQHSGTDMLALPGWGLPGLTLSSAYASPWHPEGSAGVAPSISLDQLPGDAQKLREVVLAAAELGPPSLPPRGSRFDDMDAFSSSLISATAAGPLAAVARQQQQDVWQRRQVRVNSKGSAVIARPSSSIHRSSGRSSTALAPRMSLQELAPGGQPDSSAAAAVVADHLDGLLSGLSLLGERAPTDVGQELAVARSVHQVMYNHHARYMHTGVAAAGQASSSSSRAGSRATSTDSLKQLLKRSSTPLALTLQATGMQQISSWLSSSTGWLARSAAAAFKHAAESSAGDTTLQEQQQRLQAARCSLRAGQVTSGGGGQVTGSLWQYNRAAAGSSAAAGGTAPNPVGAGLAGGGGGPGRFGRSGGADAARQQPPIALGKAARRWR